MKRPAKNKLIGPFVSYEATWRPWRDQSSSGMSEVLASLTHKYQAWL